LQHQVGYFYSHHIAWRRAKISVNEGTLERKEGSDMNSFMPRQQKVIEVALEALLSFFISAIIFLLPFTVAWTHKIVILLFHGARSS